MKLLVDIGNTRLKWVALEAGFIVKRGHLLHRGHDPDAWGDRLWRYLKRPERALIANVAGPRAAQALSDWLAERWSLAAEFVASEERNHGIVNAYETPEKLGVDRWVAMIGAHRLYRQHCIVIDCGTAMTIDALDGGGHHQGGVIVPGMRLMHEALFRKTSLIPEQEMGEVVLLGKNTQECVWGGIVHALAATIDRVSARMARSLEGEVQRLLTGGNAEVLLPFLEHDYRLEPDLIFRGLRVIADDTDADRSVPSMAP